jgi:hydroxymethylpyrimidine/phosphomethylpyrimidine kinase
MTPTAGPGPGLDQARPSVLVFAGLDPSGGAGIAADILAIAAQGAHALPIVTALTVQDNNRVYEVVPVAGDIVARQAQALIGQIAISAVKIGIPGNRANAQVMADLIVQLRRNRPPLPVILDPVLASGNGDALSHDDAVQILAPLLPLATLIVPNLPEARTLGGPGSEAAQQAQHLHALGCEQVLITGGHGSGDEVINRWYGLGAVQEWRWPRLPGAFHGSGCTLASAIAARLALGDTMAQALATAQAYCHNALTASFAIADGQRIPLR